MLLPKPLRASPYSAPLPSTPLLRTTKRYSRLSGTSMSVNILSSEPSASPCIFSSIPSLSSDFFLKSFISTFQLFLDSFPLFFFQSSTNYLSPSPHPVRNPNSLIDILSSPLLLSPPHSFFFFSAVIKIIIFLIFFSSFFLLVQLLPRASPSEHCVEDNRQKRVGFSLSLFLRRSRGRHGAMVPRCHD